jgi:hypothetical protein
MANQSPAPSAPAKGSAEPSNITDGLTSQLFGRTIEPDKPAPTLDYDSLRYGAIVTHKGIRVIEYQKDGKNRKTKLHMFATQGGLGPWFSVFGTANLDSQLRKARTGAVLLLRYAGKQKEAGSEQEVHMWEVRETTASPAMIQQLRERPEWRERELALEGAIGQAALAEQERRAQRSSGSGPDDEAPPPHDDNDRPF